MTEHILLAIGWYLFGLAVMAYRKQRSQYEQLLQLWNGDINSREKKLGLPARKEGTV